MLTAQVMQNMCARACEGFVYVRGIKVVFQMNIYSLCADCLNSEFDIKGDPVYSFHCILLSCMQVMHDRRRSLLAIIVPLNVKADECNG